MTISCSHAAVQSAPTQTDAMRPTSIALSPPNAPISSSISRMALLPARNEMSSSGSTHTFSLFTPNTLSRSSDLDCAGVEANSS